jgi:hypothetical protein
MEDITLVLILIAFFAIMFGISALVGGAKAKHDFWNK